MNADEFRMLNQVAKEYERAKELFPRFHGTHEGYAVIKEELDELWDAVKADYKHQARKEALQVAAMALRFMIDIPDSEEAQDG
jgi:hypothetical protein